VPALGFRERTPPVVKLIFDGFNVAVAQFIERLHRQAADGKCLNKTFGQQALQKVIKPLPAPAILI